VDEDELDRRPVWVVEVPRSPASEAPDDLRIFGDLDPRTFLPLRVRLASAEPGWSTAFRIRYRRMRVAPERLFDPSVGPS
jgi:hypothetical protein